MRLTHHSCRPNKPGSVQSVVLEYYPHRTYARYRTHPSAFSLSFSLSLSLPIQAKRKCSLPARARLRIPPPISDSGQNSLLLDAVRAAFCYVQPHCLPLWFRFHSGNLTSGARFSVIVFLPATVDRPILFLAGADVSLHTQLLTAGDTAGPCRWFAFVLGFRVAECVYGALSLCRNGELDSPLSLVASIRSSGVSHASKSCRTPRMWAPRARVATQTIRRIAERDEQAKLHNCVVSGRRIFARSCWAQAFQAFLLGASSQGGSAPHNQRAALIPPHRFRLDAVIAVRSSLAEAGAHARAPPRAHWGREHRFLLACM